MRGGAETASARSLSRLVAQEQAQVNGQAREREGGRGGGVCVVGQGGAGGRVCEIYTNCDAKRPAMQGAQRTSDPPGLTPKTATMRHEMPHAKPPGHMTEAATATGHILATGKHSRMPRPTHARTARRRRRNWSCAGGKRLRRRRATLHLPPCASSHTPLGELHGPPGRREWHCPTPSGRVVKAHPRGPAEVGGRQIAGDQLTPGTLW